MTSDCFGNVIFLPELEDGRLRQESQDGPMIEGFGREAPPASHSLSLGEEWGKKTNVTSGLNCFVSSAPDDLMSSWVSRLQQRLGKDGSTECLLTWKESNTPARRPLYRLVPSMRRTEGTEFGMWPTPMASDGSKGDCLLPAIKRRKANGRQIGLAMAARLQDGTGSGGALNPRFACWLMQFPQEWEDCAPTAMPYRRGLPQK